MNNRREGLELVKNILQITPKGMTITEISEKLEMNRNSIAKYLDMLLMAGLVDLKTFGRSKIYRLSSRIPNAVTVSLSSELILFLDESLRIMDVNDQFLKFTGLDYDKVIGRSIDEINVGILVHPEILLNLKDALRGREYSIEIRVQRGKETYHFKAKLIPVTARDHRSQIALVFEDITARKLAEIALKESETRYRAVVEDQTDMICRMTPDMSIMFVNEAWRRYFSIFTKFFQGQKYLDIIPSSNRAAYLQNFNSIRMKRPVMTFENQIIFPDGTTHWLQSIYRGIFNPAGQLIEMQIVARDITEQKKAEESLHLALFSMDNATDTIVWVNSSGQFIYVNITFSRKLGYSRQELLTMHVWDIDPMFHPDSWDAHWKDVKQKNHLKLESAHRARDGTLIPMEITVNYMRFGDIEYHCVFARDLSEHKYAQVTSRENQYFMRSIIDAMPIPVYFKDRRGVYFSCNPAFEKYLGIDKDRIIGATAYDLLTPDSADMCTRLDAALLNDGIYQVKEVCILLADGSVRQFVYHKVPFHDTADSLGGIIGVLIDISHELSQ